MRAALIAIAMSACAEDGPRGVATHGAEPGLDPVGDSSGAGTDGFDGSLCEDIELAAATVLHEHCGACHVPGATAVPQFDWITDFERMVTDGKLVPGAAERSTLFLAVLEEQMPPPSEPPVPASDVATLQAWIDLCLHPEPCLQPEWIGRAEMLERMRVDAAGIDPADRSSTRWLTLTHLHDAGICGPALDSHRRALAKAMASLSWAPGLAAPVPIDAEATIYRVDLRDYDWDAATWDLLVAADPYAIAGQGDAALDLAAYTDTPIPMVRGDWLAAVGLVPPLYHEVLDLPATAALLQARLGVDVAADLLAGEVVRAGFADSAIAHEQRLIERHALPDASDRAYWLTYEFASATGTSDLFAHPLDFEADASLHLFTLPNGLQAAMITDALGLRIDRVPDAIMTDPLAPDHDVVNGRSCLRCHAGGVIAHDDGLRAHVEDGLGFDDATREQIERLHPLPASLRATQTLDAEHHASALARLGVPPLAEEPIGAVVVDYDADLDITRAAAEIGVPREQLVVHLAALPAELQPLAYGTVDRAQFAARFAEIACALQLAAC